MESIRKVHALAYNREMQLRDKKEELSAAWAEIACLCD